MTKNLICAVPCNGVHELCEDNLDEQCQGPGLVMTLVSIFLISISFIFTSSALSYHRLKKTKCLDIAGIELKRIKTNENICISGEQTQHDGTNLYLQLSVCKIKMDASNAIRVAESYYDQVSLGSCYEKDCHIMMLYGTNDISAFFFDCVDKSLAVRVHMWLHSKVFTLFTILRMIYFGAFIIMMKGTVSLCLRYSDLSKDLLFLYMIWLQFGQYEDGSFPKAVFYIFAASLLLTELGNMCVTIIADFNGTGWRKVYVVMRSPLMPAYYIYEILHCELSKLITLHSCSDAFKGSQNCVLINRHVNEIDLQIWSLQLKLAKLQYIENVLENIPMLIILLLISLLNETSSRTVVNLQNIFMDDRIYIGWGLAAISVVSLIRGQVNFLAASKNGCQTGIVLLIVYFLLGLSSRYSI